ncbi:MAG TPA: ABC transporter permease [Gemmatimonadaceae bacterium]|nr:ABC transporter permease [Gemmatimonadaceae bacterium]
MLTTVSRVIRTLRHSPVFAAVAILSLAAGIGLSTATFAIVDSMMNPKIPIADVDRLFREDLRFGNQKNRPSILEQVRALEALPGIERAGVSTGGFNLAVSANDVQTWLGVQTTTPDFFATLGVTPVIGRIPSGEEIRQQSAVVLTNSAWRRLFPKRASIDGATVTIADREYAVVGVLGPGFETLTYGDVWIPAASAADLEGLTYPAIIAKLRVGTDSITIRPQLAALAARFTAAYVAHGAPAYQVRLRGMRPKPPSFRDNELALLMAGIAIGVLAIACTNVSALSLARGLSRRRDHALRVALGASRLAIGGEVLSEVAVLGIFGAILGFLFAAALTGTLTHMVPEDLAQRGYLIPELNGRVFALTSLTLFIGILVAGALPAWRASRSNPSSVLKDNAGTTTGRSRHEFKVLVMGELAIAMVLLMLASLLTLSTRNLVNYDFGFDAHRVLTVRVTTPRGRDSLSTNQGVALMETSARRVAAMPGVAAVSTQGFGRLDGDQVTSDDSRNTAPLRLKTGFVEAGAGYFSALGTPPVSGRDFQEGDAVRGAVMLSKHAARLLFPHGDAVGRMVKLGGERSNRAWLPVIGVAPDVRLGMYGEDPGARDTVVYAMTARHSFDNSSLVVRQAGDAAALPVAIRRAVRDRLPAHSTADVSPFEIYFASLLRLHRFYDGIFSFLSAASLILAAGGLFSVLSYTVSQRLREFAVRQALGASPRQVLRLVMRNAFELALGGTAFGALLSFWASAGVSTALFGVKNTDPVSLVIAELTLLAVTMLASLVPAYRAMKADPVEVLRAT